MGRLIRIVLLSLLLAAGGVTTASLLYRALQAEPTGNAATVRFNVERGDTPRRIAERLRAQGLIRSALRFHLLARLHGAGNHLKAGEYEVRPCLPARDLLRLFASGRVLHHSVTFVEGWTFRELLDALHRHEAVRQTLSRPPTTEQLERIRANLTEPEGRFFPDTYYFLRGDTDVAILRRALRRMDAILAEEWQGRSPDLRLDTPDQALIAASIIEKETAVAEERPLISGVLHRRLSLGMPLQMDPTVVYGLRSAFHGDLTWDHLRQDGPYNTYVRQGLPPTPIAMPSRASIHAALHPAPGDVLYFVARGDGRHEFSATLAEHNRAVARYQRRKGDG